MNTKTGLLALLTSSLALGCLPESKSLGGSGSDDDTTTPGDTSDGSESTSAGDSSDGSGSTTDGVEACSLATNQADCEGTTTGSGHPPCAWVDVRVVEDARACTLSEAEPRCIDVVYQGAGCLLPNTCGKDEFEVPSIYHRVEGDVVEVFARSLCETQPVGWELCTWLADSTGEVDVEPAVCGCLCPSG